MEIVAWQGMGVGEGPLKAFMARTAGMDYVARGEALARDAGIHGVHQKFVVQGQTQTTEVCICTAKC